MDQNSSSMDPNCVPEKRLDLNGFPRPGACTDSRTGAPGYRNSTGFPPCCDLYSSSDGNSYWMSSRKAFSQDSIPVSSSVSQDSIPVSQDTAAPVYSLSQAAAGCVAKNPNYPALAGSCVYNPLNPCVGNYETTDTRFGTKMCCAPRTAANAACYPQQGSTFKAIKSNFGKSNFGAGTNLFIFLLLLLIIMFIIAKKYKWF